MIRILSGADRYDDPWHPFAETSACLRDLLESHGQRVEVRDDDPSCLDGLAEVDLLLVNLGGNPTVELEPDPRWQRAHAELGHWVAGGGRVLAVHTAANTFPDWSGWPQILGGQWIRGRSRHPRRCVATFEQCPGAEDHPVWSGLETVTVYDERYSFLDVAEDSTPLVRHELSEEWEVMGWAHGRRVVYDGMGHNARSYQSPTRCRLLLNEVEWLLDA